MRANDILDEAKDLIADRGKDYGLAALNHLRIAKLWSAYLERDIEPHEVAICMALVKISRLQENATPRRQLQGRRSIHCARWTNCIN
jgi:hypothetical protein